MNFRHIVDKKVLSYISFLIISIFIYIYIYSIIPTLEKKFENEIIKYYSESIVQSIKKITNKYKNYITLNGDKETIDKLNLLKEKLSVLISKKTKYIAIITRDKENKYRYILNIAENSPNIYGLLFIPLPEEIDKIHQIFISKKEQFVIHKTLKTIGITYYIPIKQNNHIKAITIVDFSFEVLKNLKNYIDTIKKSIIALISFSTLFIFITIASFIRNILLQRKVFQDNLTGTYNRAFLSKIIDTIDLNNYIVLMIDIDYFKKINDTYGHKIGDEILKQFAKLLKENLRKEDIIIRYGGEEFLILIRKDRKTKINQIIKISERLLDKIRNTKFANNLNITASIGINIDSHKSRNLADAIKKADIALYKAKKEGRDKIEIYKEDTSQLDIPLTELKDIIENRNIICYYQPIYNLKTKEVLYYEALARVVYEGKHLAPFKYLEIIKGTSMYAKFTKAVIEYNIRTLQKYPINISINLSPNDVINKTILEELLKVDEKLVKRIKLEIVETEEVSNQEDIKRAVSKLVEYGYEIALDDFGKGYINFFYITELPVKYIKIDGSIIKKIPQDIRYYKLAKTMQLFGKETEKELIAEFIENEEIYEKLLELNIKYGQGYLLSKPKQISEFFNR